MKITPAFINHLEPNQVFVFGSNRAGRHGKGAAKIAAQKFGARYGQGDGLMGQSYGIPTKDRNLGVLSLREIDIAVKRFICFAVLHPELEFLVTPIGCGLAGYSPKQIAPMFRTDSPVENIALPADFAAVIAGL